MEFKIIPNEQTPKIDLLDVDTIEYIEMYKEQFLSFLEFTKTKEDAAGLAANQVSLDGERFMKRIFVLRDMTNFNLRLIINPLITEYIGIKEIKVEGCLTWIDKKIVAERSRAVKVNYHDIDGNYHEGEVYKGFEGQIWQHEINHLNGIEENVQEFAIQPRPINPGRNELCHCGSGKKYKKCCLLLV